MIQNLYDRPEDHQRETNEKTGPHLIASSFAMLYLSPSYFEENFPRNSLYFP